ncbi:AAEL013758-PA [Aedes aegypti]|uniref:AAEL013758-PA n=1 Tax=Aedes aegypti TaxID=7159 RepID=Q16I88_AEDAE|nr:AAEL013758-PA [Aedes aegypti]
MHQLSPPRFQSFQETQSDSQSVTLRGVTRDLTGQFQCEVSEDAPLFHTDIRFARMQVVELPKEDPQMQLEKTHITTGDSFRAICTVGTSFPSANITWYINSKKIHRSPYQRITYRSYEGTPTFSSLDMYPHSQVLQDIYQTMPPMQTSLAIMCEISILHIYTKSVHKMLIVSDLVTTVSPSLLGLDGSHNRRNGDPDNSALTVSGVGVAGSSSVMIWSSILAVAVVYHRCGKGGRGL